MYRVLALITLLALLHTSIMNTAMQPRADTAPTSSTTMPNTPYIDYTLTHVYSGRGHFYENNLVINTGRTSPYKVIGNTPYIKTPNVIVNDINGDQLNEVAIPYAQIADLGHKFNLSVNVKIYTFIFTNNTIYRSLTVCPLYRTIENSSTFKIRIYDLDIDNDNTVEIIGYTIIYNYLTNETSIYIWYIDYHNKTYRTNKIIELNITGSQPNIGYVDLGYLRNSSDVLILLGVPFYNGTYIVYIVSLNEGDITEYAQLVGSYGLIVSNGQYSGIVTYHFIVSNDSISSFTYLYLVSIDLDLKVVYDYNTTEVINRTDVIEQPQPPSQGIPPGLTRRLVFIENDSLVLGIISDTYMAIYKYNLNSRISHLENFSLYSYMLKPESIDSVFYINYIVADIDHDQIGELVVFTSTVNDSLAYTIIDHASWNVAVKYDAEFSIDFSISSVIASADLDGDGDIEVVFLVMDPPSIVYYSLREGKRIEINLGTVDQAYVGRSRVFFPIIISDMDNDHYIELSLVLPNQIIIVNDPFSPVHPLPESPVMSFAVLASITLLLVLNRFRKAKR